MLHTKMVSHKWVRRLPSTHWPHWVHSLSRWELSAEWILCLRIPEIIYKNIDFNIITKLLGREVLRSLIHVLSLL
jgi:hypothetical protein